MKSSNPCFFLISSGYGIYNRKLASTIGLSQAVFLSELLEIEEHNENQLVNHQEHGTGWFYATVDKVCERTGILKKEQATIIKKLKNLGLIEVKVFGLPAKRYFRINKEKVLELFNLSVRNETIEKKSSNDSNQEKNIQKILARSAQRGQLEVPKGDNWMCPKGTTCPYIYINTIEEPNKEIYAPTEVDANENRTSSSKSKEKIQVSAQHPDVHVTLEEHKALVEKHGEELTKEAYTDLQEWKESADKKVVAKHKSDYLRLRKWVIPQLLEAKMKEDRLKKQKIAPHRRNSKLVTEGDSDYDSFKLRRL